MDKMHIFAPTHQVGNPLFLKWAHNKNDIKINFIKGFDELDFYRQWNTVSGLSEAILLINQLMQTEEDIQILDLFINSFVDSTRSMADGNTYYMPRPNIYLPTDQFGMAIIKKPVLISQKSILRKIIKKYSLQLLNQLPDNLSTIIKNKLKSLLNSLPYLINSNSQKSEIYTAEEKHPEEKISNTLFFLSSAHWQEWRPPLSLWNKQVVDKVNEFFPYPLGIHVILLNQCNLKCVMCPYHSLSYRPHQTSEYFDELRSLNDELFTTIANYAGKNKISLQFGQIEEPLLHKNIFSYFRQAKNRGVPHIHLTTNGTLLSNQKAIQLANSGVDSVMFSVDAATPETYLQIRGKDLLALEENIKFFMPLARKKNIRVMISFILQPQAREEKEAFLDKWKKIGVNSVVFYVLTEHDPHTGQSLRSEEMYNKGERYPCASPWIQSVVFPDGDISLCCKTMTDVGWRGVVSVGNLNQQSFEEIWLGDKYNQVRRELLENFFTEFDVCSDCHIWSASSYIIETTKEYIKSYNETMETINFL